MTFWKLDLLTSSGIKKGRGLHQSVDCNQNSFNTFTEQILFNFASYSETD
jgi:hypothetical protein